MKLKKTSFQHPAIYGLALLNILIHMAVYKNLEYHRDELLYFSLGLHPDFGYATVPPLIGWIASAMQLVFGFSLFAVRIFPAMLGGVLVLLTADIAKILGGKIYAQILGALAILIMPVTLRAFYLFQPVGVDVFFWVFTTWLLLRYINTNNDRYLVALGASFGIAMLNKYLIALWIPALLLPLAFSKYWMIFKKRAFYIALFAGFIIFLPNLVWQLTKGLPVINHMQQLHDHQLVHVSRLGFLTDQLLNPFAGSILIIPGFFYLLKNRKYRFLAYSVLIVILSLFLLRGKSYYSMGIFPVLAASGGLFYENILKKNGWRIALPMFLLLITWRVLPFGIPIYKQNGMVAYFQRLQDKYGLEIGRRFEDGTIHSLPQDYADQLGWEELTQITVKAYALVPDKSKALIYAENYGQAGAIALIGKKYGLPEPVSFHESFVYWVPKIFDPDIEYFIYINDELGEDVQKAFDNIQVVGKISNKNAREYGTGVYLCTRPKASFNKLWTAVLKQKHIIQ